MHLRPPAPVKQLLEQHSELSVHRPPTISPHDPTHSLQKLSSQLKLQQSLVSVQLLPFGKQVLHLPVLLSHTALPQQTLLYESQTSSRA
jgi:hypothetical protein